MTEETQDTQEAPKRIPKIRDILVWPNPLLKRQANRVTEFDKNLADLAADLFATMGANDGVGLAAPQIGVPKSMFVLRIEDDKPMVFVNPTVTVVNEEEYEWEEGCLSVPGYFKKRKRPTEIAVRFQDVAGTEHHVQFGKLYAFAIQHEVDHLYGKCFVDGLSRLHHPFIKKKIRKQHPVNEKRAAMVRIQLENQGKM